MLREHDRNHGRQDMKLVTWLPALLRQHPEDSHGLRDDSLVGTLLAEVLRGERKALEESDGPHLEGLPASPMTKAYGKRSPGQGRT